SGSGAAGCGGRRGVFVATSYKLQATSYKLQATSYKLQATLDWKGKPNKFPRFRISTKPL
ncbi:MAG: hypothetical protein VX379_09770, partial [Pseudomonadota bacterium]|nr:hypothetical protein [Pseudomonadota bacterium]